MRMTRRGVLGGSAALAAPRLAAAQGARVLKFVPQADLALLDPVQTTAFVTRNHALLVFDTLYGVDANWKVQPQMVEGHVVENDGKTWKLTLRDGLRFHDNTPVLARDVVASLRRWGKRDVMGQGIFDITDELSAPFDRVVLWKLKRPYPLLPEALGKMNNTIGGRSIRVIADGISHYYTHLEKFGNVSTGQPINAGNIIGYMGNSGNAASTPVHLHFGMYRNGKAFNPYQTLHKSYRFGSH